MPASRTCRTAVPEAAAFACLLTQNVDCLPLSADEDTHDTCAVYALPNGAVVGHGWFVCDKAPSVGLAISSAYQQCNSQSLVSFAKDTEL
jgi:hypothetical protein